MRRLARLPCLPPPSAAFLPLLGSLALAVGCAGAAAPCPSLCFVGVWVATDLSGSISHRPFHLYPLQSQADPNYKLIAAAYPYMARRLLTDPAPELR